MTTEFSISPHLGSHATFGILDTEEAWQQFSQPVQRANGETVVKSELLLDGLHCAACSGIIERGLHDMPGIVEAKVSASRKRATVTWNPKLLKPSQVFEKIIDLGYSAVPATHQKDSQALRKEQRTALWRWMVAGFCMMQVMMYAGAHYFTETGEIAPDSERIINWASWLLTLPVLLFSSQPFFKNAFNDLKHRRISMDLPVALGIIITFIVSSASTFDKSGSWGSQVYFDSLTMFVFFLLSARLLEAKMHHRTMGALESIMSRLPESCEKLGSDGQFHRVLNHALNVGDTVRIHLGEAFPADGRLLSEVTKVDESLLTGESKAIDKTQHDEIIAGSYNLGPTVTMTIEKLGAATQYGQIVSMIKQAAEEKPRLTELADKVARPFLWGVLLAAAIAAMLVWDQGRNHALMTAAAVLIVTCPCALSLAAPAAMLTSAGALINKGLLVKRLQAIENLTEIDTVIFDKTGTLTTHTPKIHQIEHRDSVSRQTVLRLVFLLANQSRHPLCKAITSDADAQAQLPPLSSTTFEATENIGQGIEATLNEAQIAAFGLSELTPGTVKLGSASFCGTSVTDNRVQTLYLSDSFGWLATFSFDENIKPEAFETVQWLKHRGIRVELLSGDQSDAVAKVAQTLSIDAFKSACRPEDKFAHLNILKQQGKRILMVGDGLNDGPTLAAAHVSVAIGKGVPLAISQSDMVMLTDDLRLLPTVFHHANKTLGVIKQNIVWAVIYNVICIPMAFLGYLPAWLAGLGMAISSLIVIVNALRLSRITAFKPAHSTTL